MEQLLCCTTYIRESCPWVYIIRQFVVQSMMDICFVLEVSTGQLLHPTGRYMGQLLCPVVHVKQLLCPTVVKHKVIDSCLSAFNASFPKSSPSIFHTVAFVPTCGPPPLCQITSGFHRIFFLLFFCY